jgi:hypothetical protein
VDVSDDDVPLPLMGKVQVMFNPLLKGTVQVRMKSSPDLTNNSAGAAIC